MNLLSALKLKYPEGSHGGECAAWAEQFFDFGPVGDSYSQKKNYINSNQIANGQCYISANITEVARGFRVGDVVVTKEGTFMGFGNGHVAIIIDSVNLLVAESNFKKDGRVHYGRKLNPKNVYGIIRAPFKLDLGVCELSYSVLINNQKWQVGFLTQLSDKIFSLTGGKLKVNFYPLMTKVDNWWYDTQLNQIDGQFYKIIAKSFIDQYILPLAFSTNNKIPNVAAFIVRPDQWQGESFGHQQLNEIGWCDSASSPCEIQIASGEFDLSPWYSGVRLVEHGLMHELAHRLNYLNGLNDLTHLYDNPASKNLDQVFNNLDWGRVITNL